MNSSLAPAALSLSSELAHRVEAFELALERNPGADLSRHLPPCGHPLYLAVLGELIRVDLEHTWTRGRQKRVVDYTTRFPAVLVNPRLLAAVAFEEYRQRLRSGERVRPEEYQHRYALDTSGWEDIDLGSVGPPTGARDEFLRTALLPGGPADEENAPKTAAVPELRMTHEGLGAQTPMPAPRKAARERVLSDAEAVSEWQEAAASLPDVGTEFVGFHLVEELGRGAFGRVYLARQGDLAGRLVALKVARGLAAESRTLAQLQHTNIVPIYSYHNAGPFQAVCMPFLGGTTLAQVVRALSEMPGGVPSSGKELRSTVGRGKVETAVGTHSGNASGPGSALSEPRSAVAPATPAAAPVARIEAATEGWARLEGMPFVDAVLALGGQLADGLAHAHRQGILHRDLKPANVLLTDDGRPMLLDFNLAEDTKLRGSAERAMIGGTLPYMAPEQMVAFHAASGTLDERCDLYGLGVILFELLTSRHPFPVRKGSVRNTVPQMIADRAVPPLVQALNPAVSPGVESIVRKCLAPDPAQRYQTAEQLREDIDRHLANRPLRYAADPSFGERARKWSRRHPRLASATTVGALATVLLVGTVVAGLYARERTRGVEARGRFADHQTAFRDAQSFLDDRTRSAARLDEGLEKLRGVLKGYGVPEDAEAGAWQDAPALSYLAEPDRQRVRGDVGETFFLMAQVSTLQASAVTDPAQVVQFLEQAARWNALAEHYGRDRLPRAVFEQRASIAEKKSDRAEAERLREVAGRTPLQSARDLYLAGSQHARQGRHRDAIRHLQRATQLDPANFSAWFLRGTSHLALEQHELAVMCFGTCVSLRPEFAPAWQNRGLAFAQLRFHDQAREDYDQAIKLDPKFTEALIQRAEVFEALGDRDSAIADYTRALETGAAPARVYFKRATARQLNNDAEGARADREAGFKVKPTDELSWVARAENRLADDPKGALADAEEALKINPWSVFALQLKAAILSESLNRSAEAIAVLDRTVELHPDYVPARAGRGVLLARAGKRAEALQDAREALRRDTRAPNLYQVGCIYALSAKGHADDRREALHLIWSGLKTGFALDIVDADTDLNALREDKDFKDIVKDAKALHALRQEKK